MARSPAPFHSTTAAHSARQAAGRPLPALAGQRSAFLPTARRAPFSDNAWKAIVEKPQDRPPTIAFSHYQKRPSLRSTGRGLVLRTRSALSAAMGVFCFCEPDRAAVLDRGPLPCACGVWGRLVTCAGAKLRHIAPTRPASLAAGFASLPTAPLPPQKNQQGKRANQRSGERFKNPSKKHR